MNDTPLARRLAGEGRLPDVAVETSGAKTDDAPAAYPDHPLWLHVPVWDWSLAHPDALAHRDALAVTRARLAATGAPWLSVHVGFAAAEVAYDGGMQARTPTLPRDVVLARATATLAALRNAVDVPVLAENLDDQARPSPDGTRPARPAYAHVCDPTFPSDLTRAADVGLLLDLAHAQVSAAAQGRDVHAYLAALPLHRVRQIHVSGPRPRGDGTLDDAHATLRDADLALLAWTLARTRPWGVTLEYGRDEAGLLRDLDRVRATLAA
ncbi:MAG: DUF692 family protein [Trueperaceae bacterium]|nr:DUF692 family protein [Trueperaceae bacterium]